MQTSKYSEKAMLRVCYAIAGVTVCVIGAMAYVIGKVVDDVTA